MWSLMVQYAIALGAVGVALAARVLLEPVLGERVPFLAVFIVLLPLALLVRPGPFLAAAVAGCIGSLMLFFPRPGGTATVIQTAMFALAALAAAVTAWLSQRSQARIRAADSMLRAFVDESPTLKWITDARDRIVYVNNAMASVLGRSPDEVIGRKHADILPQPAAQAALARINAVRSTGEPNISVEPIETPGGDAGARVLEWRRFRLQHRSDNGALVAGMANDVTERQLLEAKLTETDRRKNEFLAALSHELRNMLSPINTAAGILSLRSEGDGDLMRCHDVIARQVRQMARLVDDLSDTSRISRGKLELRLERTDIATVIRSAVEISQSAIERGHHHIEVILPEQPIQIDADPSRLVQVFSNLLINAAKYTNREGRIRVEAQLVDHAVKVTVSDNGIGIDRDTLPHIFELFNQADQASPHSYGGLGVGLSLVRSLVELHGGEVQAHSEGRGHGSTFTVIIPTALERRALVS
jgi:PAS domain S-box-containing protein